MTDVFFELGLKVLYIGPGLVLGVILGKWGLFRRVPTAPLCAMVFGVTSIAGVTDAATLNLTDFHWIGVALWTPFYVWAVRRPEREIRVPAAGEIGPASRAFRSRS